MPADCIGSAGCLRTRGAVESVMMTFRVFFSMILCTLAANGQTKKIIVEGADPAMLRDYQSVTTKARVVGVNRSNILQEITDADAMIGAITPEEVRAGKNLKWVAVMSAGVENVLMKSGGNDLRDSNIVLTNNKVVQGPELADHAFAM